MAEKNRDEVAGDTDDSGGSDDGGGGGISSGGGGGNGGGDGIEPTGGPAHASLHVESDPLSVTMAVPAIPSNASAAETDPPGNTPPLLSAPLDPTVQPLVGVINKGGVSRASAVGNHLTWLDGEADVRRRGSVDELTWKAGFYRSRDGGVSHQAIDISTQSEAGHRASDSDSEDGAVRFAERQRDAAQVPYTQHPYPDPSS